MSAIHTWVCFLLWIGFATQNKTPDVHVTCIISEECILPCSFKPGSKEVIQWFRQDEVVYAFQHGGGKEKEKEEEGDDSDDNSSEEEPEAKQLIGRASIFPHLVSRGNATLILKESGPKDRGKYRCHVHTAEGEYNMNVIVKMEAPIRGLILELSRLSGFEEMKCIVRNVYPPPRITWATEPPTFEDLRPVTRKQADKHGLYTVDSRLKMLNGQPDLIYICKATSSYGGPAWTASLREREIRGYEGKDLTIPCSAPSYLNNPALEWSFINSEDPSHILTYDLQTGRSISSSPWDTHVELDGFRVPFGDGSLRLMDPNHEDHTGSYECVFSSPYSKHTERADITIDSPTANRSASEETSYWWIVGLVLAVLVLALAGMLAYLKAKGGTSKPRNDPEEATELHPVKEQPVDNNLNASSPLSVGSTNGQSGLQTSFPLT